MSLLKTPSLKLITILKRLEVYIGLTKFAWVSKNFQKFLNFQNSFKFPKILYSLDFLKLFLRFISLKVNKNRLSSKNLKLGIWLKIIIPCKWIIEKVRGKNIWKLEAYLKKLRSLKSIFITNYDFGINLKIAYFWLKMVIRLIDYNVKEIIHEKWWIMRSNRWHLLEKIETIHKFIG